MYRYDAVQQLDSWVKSASLLRHCYATERVMRSVAQRENCSAEEIAHFGICGLLHDADWETYPQEHPQRIVAWLRERGEQAIAHAISAHSVHWGVHYESLMDRALVASDELTGLVTACSLVRPDGILSLTIESAMNKFKNKRFAAGVDRGEITEGVRIMGVDLRVHMELVLSALRGSAAELGLVGGTSAADFAKLRLGFEESKAML